MIDSYRQSWACDNLVLKVASSDNTTTYYSKNAKNVPRSSKGFPTLNFCENVKGGIGLSTVSDCRESCHVCPALSYIQIYYIHMYIT